MLNCTFPTDPRVSNMSGGVYALWKIPVVPCLQYWSDLIVNATFDLATPNQQVPSWVFSLPPDLQALKIAMVHQYGSPNVFSQFEPHVTIAADSATPQRLSDIVSSPAFPAVVAHPDVQDIAIGSAGPFGTVLRGQNLGRWNLSDYLSDYL